MPQMYWIIPVEGGSGNRPDNTLPGGQGGYPSQPIYHPGHPDHGLPAFPEPGTSRWQGGGRPDQGLPPYPEPGASGGRHGDSLE